jgi:hypothetical protein
VRNSSRKEISISILTHRFRVIRLKRVEERKGEGL